VYAPPRRVPQPSLSGRGCWPARPSRLRGQGRVFAVEMFLLRDGTLLVNEIAPRPHNSGHYTIEACSISQYDAHLRAILDLPIPEAG